MSHAIYKFDNIAYDRNNGTPWHKLGVPNDGLMTPKDATKIIGWDVYQEELFTSWGESTGKFANYREVGNEKILLGVVGNRYEVFQNEKLLELIETVISDDSKPVIDTVGSLYNGQKVFVSCILPDEILLPDSPIKQYALFTNAHDGSYAFTAKWTPTRVVCQNTLNLALGMGESLRTRHINFSSLVPNIREFLKLNQEVLGGVQSLFDLLGDKEVTTVEAVDILKTVWPNAKAVPNNGLEKSPILHTMNIFETFESPTLWGLYNAGVEMIDHRKTYKSEDRRFESTLFGHTNEKKSELLEAILAFAS